MNFLYVAITLFAFYSLVILFYRSGWRSLALFIPLPLQPSTRISVIIPARNEEQNIGSLLTALQHQSYPAHLFEVIVVDDHSEDKTTEVVKKFPGAKLIELRFDHINAYKKKAIETGIAAATGDLIVTTDADCIVHSNWLKTIAAFKEEKKAVFIAAPVVIECNSSVLQVFQALDFMTLQGITAAAVHKRVHNMCNGANLAYERKVFFEAGGFSGIDHIASGDDMLLMGKIALHHPGEMHYLLSKDAIVTTAAAKTWKEFLQQRIRWASKGIHYKDAKISGVLLLVYLFNLSLLVLFAAACRFPFLWPGLAALLIAKTAVEMLLLMPVAVFFNKQSLMKWFPVFQPVHILYTVIAGCFGLTGRFHWKGRRVK